MVPRDDRATHARVIDTKTRPQALLAHEETPPSPDELLARSARGDEAAFAALYDQTAGRLYGAALRLMRNATEAEDVTQEAYVAIWRDCARFSSERGSAVSWMMSVLHHKAVDRIRSAEAARRRDLAHELREERPAPDATAEQAVGRLEATQLRLALEELSPVQREALTLAYFEGLTHREIARRLGLPLGTAKTRIRDGLLRLRADARLPVWDSPAA